MFNKTHKTPFAAAQIAALGLAAVLAAPASAAVHTYAGTACQPMHEEYNIKRNYNGTILNMSSGATHTYDCPIVRTSGFPIVDVVVRVQDFGTTDLYCHLKTRKSNGSAAFYKTRTANAYGQDTLSFGGLSSSTGATILRCSVPKKATYPSGIINYYVID